MTIWPAVSTYLTVIVTAWILSRWLGGHSEEGRFVSIDGLRGYLAFGVFIQHGDVWYHFVRTGVWNLPPSRLYINLGQVSVALFFMITGFLFWTKLFQGRSEPINWYKLYLSRFLRLVPLYAAAIALLVLTVGMMTQFDLRESTPSLSWNVLKWGTFTVMGAPDLNGLTNTFIIIAGVTWTLRYEWLFYLALPLMAVLTGAATPRRFLLGGALIVGWLAYRTRPDVIYLAAFGGGIFASSLIHFGLLPNFIRSKWAALAASALIIFTTLFFSTAYQVVPLALLTLAFTTIAGGNTIFGVLAWPVSRFLGQLTYSIYLLHGMILFWVFRFVIGFERAASLPLMGHWLVILLCIPLVLVVCCATFRWIELPGMAALKKVSRWLRVA